MDLETRIRHALQDPARRPSPDFAHGVMAGLPARQTSHSWSPRSLSVPLVGATALVLTLAIVLLEPVLSPNGSVVPNPSTLLGSASPGVSGSAMATSGTYFDGIPRKIEGQPVLRGDALRQHVAASKDATPFLIGGYVGAIYFDCYIAPNAPGSPLLAPCDDGIHLSDAPAGANGGLGPRLVVDAAIQELPRGAPGVLRVHVHDRRAVDCAPEIRQRCEEAIVVEAVVWSGAAAVLVDADGIPREIDGEVVLRGSDIAATVAASVDDTPFLFGGWATGPIRWRCPASPPDSPRPALLPCGPGTGIQLMDGPDRVDGVLVISLDQGVRPAPGATVLRVHLHDSSTASCPETNRTACERAIVLDEVMWTQSSVLVTPTP